MARYIGAWAIAFLLGAGFATLTHTVSLAQARRSALEECARTFDATMTDVLDRSDRVMVASSSLASFVESRIGRPVKKYDPVAPPGEPLPTWTRGEPVRADGYVELDTAWEVVTGSDGEVARVFDGERWWTWNSASGIWTAE